MRIQTSTAVCCTVRLLSDTKLNALHSELVAQTQLICYVIYIRRVQQLCQLRIAVSQALVCTYMPYDYIVALLLASKQSG
jgi:hypothetical protein